MEKQQRGKAKFSSEFGFLFLHLIPFAGFWFDISAFDWGLCVFLYFFRMFWITGGYHRYFSHRTYSTSRWFQFVIAFMAQTSVQKGALWWAANHRQHHKYSDTPEDPHSSKIYGFWYAHVGWITGPDFKETLYDKIKDYAKFDELVWLNKNHLVPPLFMMIGVFFLGGYVNGGIEGIFTAGWSTLIIGFFLSTAVLFHGTFTINSLTHMYGERRYDSNDESKNSFLFAIITMGEGWHNNHHYFQSTARQGFFWWEWDPTFYILKMFSWLGLIWDVRPVPDHIKHSKNMEHANELLQVSKDKTSVN